MPMYGFILSHQQTVHAESPTTPFIHASPLPSQFLCSLKALFCVDPCVSDLVLIVISAPLTATCLSQLSTCLHLAGSAQWARSISSTVFLQFYMRWIGWQPKGEISHLHKPLIWNTELKLGGSFVQLHSKGLILSLISSTSNCFTFQEVWFTCWHPDFA